VSVAVPEELLARFLVEAKKRTYASGGSASAFAVVPLLVDSHQLEYRLDEMLYRDVYFGTSHFAGQEVVYKGETAVWSMCYVGGWTDELENEGEIPQLATLLQAALRQVPVDTPFRGPTEYASGPYVYRNSVSGNLRLLRGEEAMSRGMTVLYRLNYAGGAVD